MHRAPGRLFPMHNPSASGAFSERVLLLQSGTELGDWPGFGSSGAVPAGKGWAGQDVLQGSKGQTAALGAICASCLSQAPGASCCLFYAQAQLCPQSWGQLCSQQKPWRDRLTTQGSRGFPFWCCKDHIRTLFEFISVRTRLPDISRV